MAPPASITEWKLDARPIVTIGGTGKSSAEFFRIAGAWRLPDGAIGIANGGTSEIRIFDARGALRTSFGRSGAGSGEFESMQWCGHSGDATFIFDSHTNRVSTITLAGVPRLTSTLTVTARGGRERFGVASRLANGQWLVTTHVSPTFDGPPGIHCVKGSAGLIPPGGSREVSRRPAVHGGEVQLRRTA